MELTGHEIGTVERVMRYLPVGSMGPNELQPSCYSGANAEVYFIFTLSVLRTSMFSALSLLHQPNAQC
jgi:hypothetical protein